MKFYHFFFWCVILVDANERNLNRTDLKCVGRPHYNVSLTAYFPDYESDNENDYLDVRGKKLRNLQDFIDGRSEYVTAAMDMIPEVPYGTHLCIPELNEHFGRQIHIQVRDYGGNLKDQGFSQVDICVRSESDSYDNAVNRLVTVYV
ncbi:uncharacterized protein [Fopius arisanus]|uniref:Uncharacterized protein n=1 Tax=Fopius arisanus TaxID=64838 RepID=A0A9R1TY49_9HYME|nr:PREDICTED: uncharacterized protein LOC105265196 [Fopius arisanus]